MKRESKKLVLALIIVTALRIFLKLFVMWHMKSMPFTRQLEIVSNIGIALHFSIGPLFYFYIRSKIESSFRLRNRDYLHFIITFTLILLLFLLNLSFWELGILRLHYLHIIAYYLFSLKIYLLYLNKEKTIDINDRKLLIVFAILAVFMLAYTPILYFYIDLVDTCLIAGSSLYFVFLLIRHKGYLKVKYKNSKLAQDKSNKIKNKIERLMETEKLYLNPGITLSTLGKKLDVNTKYLSQCINDEFKLGFNDYINSLRIEATKEQLRENDKQQYKIAHIAFNCGFESLSTFNTAFKRFTGITPSEFRDNQKNT